jgi:hypothetical protein
MNWKVWVAVLVVGIVLVADAQEEKEVISLKPIWDTVFGQEIIVMGYADLPEGTEISVLLGRCGYPFFYKSLNENNCTIVTVKNVSVAGGRFITFFESMNRSTGLSLDLGAYTVIADDTNGNVSRTTAYVIINFISPVGAEDLQVEGKIESGRKITVIAKVKNFYPSLYIENATVVNEFLFDMSKIDYCTRKFSVLELGEQTYEFRCTFPMLESGYHLLTVSTYPATWDAHHLKNLIVKAEKGQQRQCHFFTTCESCTEMASCGWFKSGKVCLTGTREGSDNGIAEGNNWVWLKDDCVITTSQATPTPSPTQTPTTTPSPKPSPTITAITTPTAILTPESTITPTVTITPTTTPTPTLTSTPLRPSFEVLLALAGLFTVAYFLRRRAS